MFVTGKTFQSSLIFVTKTRANLSGSPFRWWARVIHGQHLLLLQKVEEGPMLFVRLVWKEKHSSLLQKLNYGPKKFKTLAPGWKGVTVTNTLA
jgi:hypothetical protein